MLAKKYDFLIMLMLLLLYLLFILLKADFKICIIVQGFVHFIPNLNNIFIVQEIYVASDKLQYLCYMLPKIKN